MIGKIHVGRLVALIIIPLVLILAAITLSGCGNVELRGNAMTAAENSCLYAYEAWQRYQGDDWTKQYLYENYNQWLYYVRAGKKDMTWTPVGVTK